MKRILCLGVACFLCLSLCACSNNVKNVKILEVTSELYLQEDIAEAIDTVIREFDLHWNNCTLNELYYAGDDVTLDHGEWAERYDADEAIVLKSMFYVDHADNAASMNAGSIYHWIWILVRTRIGEWLLVDYGFC